MCHKPRSYVRFWSHSCTQLSMRQDIYSSEAILPMALMNDPSPVKTSTALLVPLASSPQAILPHAFLPAGKYCLSALTTTNPAASANLEDAKRSRTTSHVWQNGSEISPRKRVACGPAFTVKSMSSICSPGLSTRNSSDIAEYQSDPGRLAMRNRWETCQTSPAA